MLKNYHNILVEKEHSQLSNLLRDSNKCEIKISFQASYNKSSFLGYSETSPPMPFIFGPFSCYDKGPKISILVKEQEDVNHTVNIDNQLEKINLDFKIKNKEYFIYNDEILIFNRKLDKPVFANTILLGKGYMKRVWRGVIFYLKIIIDDTKTFEFNSSENIDQYFQLSTLTEFDS